MRMRRSGSIGAHRLSGLVEMTAESARARLAVRFNELLDEMQLSQTQAASMLGIPQPRISAIRNNKLEGISLERLMQALKVLGQDVEIRVSPSPRRPKVRDRVA